MIKNVAVVFWTGTGNTEAMANAVAEGAAAAGAEAAGLTVADALIANEAPDDEAVEAGQALGRALAEA